MGSEKVTSSGLSRREREIMDALYKLGKASAADIRSELASPPSYTAIRTHLSILQTKGHVRADSDGIRLIYEPTVPRDTMARTAIDNVLDTFFAGSVERIVATLLDRGETRLSPEQLDRLAEMIDRARREGL